MKTTYLLVWRKTNRLTQVQAAKKLGISRVALQELENGRLLPTINQKQKLADYFGPRIAQRMLREVRVIA